MELFKKIDLGIQLILIIVLTPLALSGVIFFTYAYFIVGGWQVFSVLIHLLQRQFFFPAKGRRYYCRTLIGVAATGLAALLSNDLGVFYLFALLFVSPAFAIWYVCICHIENKTLEHKAYAHLK
jgi:hypothetical protein